MSPQRPASPPTWPLLRLTPLAGLRSLKPALDAARLRAQQALDAWDERDEDSARLALQAELQGLSAALELCRLPIAAALLQQMRSMVEGLAPADSPDAAERARAVSARAALAEALLRAGDHLDQLLQGGADTRAALQPAFAVLQAHLGQPAQAELALIAGVLAARRAADRTEAIAEPAGAAAPRLLPAFQAAFLHWFRDLPGTGALRRIEDIALTLAAESGRAALRECWRATAALAQTLRLRETVPAEPDLPMKRLLGRVGTLLKKQAEAGEAAAAAALGDLVPGLLLALDGCPRRSALAETVLETYGAPLWRRGTDAGATPVAGPAVVTRLLGELLADYAAIKDAIDLAARGVDAGSAGLGDAAARLARLAAVLATLDLPDLAAAVATARQRLQAGPADAAGWQQLADALLDSEHRLDAALRSRHGGAPAPAVAARASAREAAQARRLVLREAQAVLLSLEAAVTPEAPALPALAPAFQTMASALRLLQEDAAADALAALARRLAADVLPLIAGPARDRLAEALAGVERLLAALGDGEAPAETALLVAQVAALGRAIDAAPAPGRPVDRARAVAPGRAGLPALVAPVDPELRGIFIDEARAVAASLAQRLPDWQRRPADRELLAQLQRGFHTIKGSGRMVGASGLSALAARFERLLDAALEGRVKADAALCALVETTVAALPPLLADFESGQAAPAEAAALMARAEALMPEGEMPGAALREVFVADTGRRLAALRAQLAGAGDADLADAALAAFHTIHGSAAVVEADVLYASAGRLETVLQVPAARAALADADGRAALADIVAVLQQALAAFATGEACATAALPGLIDRLAAAGAAQAPPAADARADFDTAFALPALAQLQALEAAAARWATAPGADPAADALVAGLQTLSAFAAAQPSAAALAAAMRSLASEIAQRAASGPPDRDWFAWLREAFEHGHQLLERARSGVPTHWPTLRPPPAAADMTETARVAASPPPPAPPAAAALDDGLAEVFAAEAGELLEQLDAAFVAWRNGDAVGPPLRIQRALHTLKGSARMAGLEAVGDLAHELESRVDRHVAAAEFPEPADFSALLAPLELLHQLHDQLCRGEAGALALAGPVPPAADHDAAAAAVWADGLFWTPPEHAGEAGPAGHESARVAVGLLETLLDHAGELAIQRSRLEEQQASLRTQLGEMAQTVTRLREQLRQLDIETDAQIAARGLIGAPAPDEPDRYAQDFDPLEMDRYSRMQELSRALAESVGDLGSLQLSLDDSASGTEALLQQQGWLANEVQQGLMATLMVPFSRQVQRLLRVVRLAAAEHGREAGLQFEGADALLDRKVLERLTAPLEHLLRNAVIHGIEPPAARQAAGKPAVGVIRVQLRRDGAQLSVEISDDGAGLDHAAIRAKAIERGLLAPESTLPDEALARFIFEPGFTTASRLTQDAGRGIGMDVVASTVKQLGGTLLLQSVRGAGTRLQLSLPLSLAVSQALLVAVADEIYALPLARIEGVGRIARSDCDALLAEDGPAYAYGGQDYRVRTLAGYLGLPPWPSGEARSLSAILVCAGEGLGVEAPARTALIVDRVIGNREIVSRAPGPQLGSVPGIAGATMLGDGRVVVILDLPALLLDAERRARLGVAAAPAAEVGAARAPSVLVVDDSITMRRVAERLLSRHGYRVQTARDGLDAIAQLQAEPPDAVLLDIEMPRADGFEVAAFMRNNARLASVPIIMITSRSGEKHRERARSLGVDRYLIKPYREETLLLEIDVLCRQSV